MASSQHEWPDMAASVCRVRKSGDAGKRLKGRYMDDVKELLKRLQGTEMVKFLQIRQAPEGQGRGSSSRKHQLPSSTDFRQDRQCHVGNAS